MMTQVGRWICRSQEQAAKAWVQWQEELVKAEMEKTGKTVEELVEEGYVFMYTNDGHRNRLNLTFEKTGRGPQPVMNLWLKNRV